MRCHDVKNYRIFSAIFNPMNNELGTFMYDSLAS